MKFGIRECCDVVFRAKSNMKVGNKIFFKNEPVIYFDTLKTSTLEGAATTVYSQGGRGNARLMSWDGERTVTFTMEDALISPEGLSILTGAGLIQGSAEKPIPVHTTETFAIGGQSDEANLDKTTLAGTITLSENVSTNDNADVYVIVLDANNNMLCEPFSSKAEVAPLIANENKIIVPELNGTVTGTPAMVLVDYYVDKHAEAMQINITPDKFGGAFYIEGSTLFREYPSQVDMPAEIIIPNGRVQSNFTFTMAGSGDPSTFTFTVDAFPDYTKFDKKEKVLASIQIIQASAEGELKRDKTNTTYEENEDGFIVESDTKVAATAIEAVALDPTVKVGESTSIFVSLTPVEATDKVVYETSSDNIELIGNRIKGISTGEATVTVKAGEKATATVSIEVIEAPKE